MVMKHYQVVKNGQATEFSDMTKVCDEDHSRESVLYDCALHILIRHVSTLISNLGRI